MSWETVEILFTEETHEYLINKQKAKTSVTSLIERQVSKTNFAGVDRVVLHRAAERGTKVHKELELFVKNGTEPATPEAVNFKNHVISNGWKFENHLEEFKVAIEWTSRSNPRNSFILAGTADLITCLNINDPNTLIPIMADHKTTSVIHITDVSWQLSLLDYMARQLDGKPINGVIFNYIKPIEFYVFHFNKSAKFEPVKVNKISDIEIERLLDAEANGEEYFPIPPDILTPRQTEELLSLEQQITQLEQTKKALELKKETLKKLLLEGFALNTDVRSIKTNSFTITYVPGGTKSVFDADAFETAYPEEAAKYKKDKVTKPQVRITLSKELKAEIPTIATGMPPATGKTIELPEPPKKGGKREKATKNYFG